MKDIFISSLQFLAKDGRVVIYGFVISSNHIHLISQIQYNFEKAKVQHNFLKYSAQQMKFELIKTDTSALEQYKVKSSDSQFKFWERPPKC